MADYQKRKFIEKNQELLKKVADAFSQENAPTELTYVTQKCKIKIQVEDVYEILL